MRPALPPPLPGDEPGRMAGLDRLSGSDLLMLQSEEAGWPMHIGVVAVLDGSSSVDGGALVDADGRFDIEAARRAVGRRLDRVPRFRQVLHVPPRLLGPPLWVDAPAVDLARHVHVRAPGAAGRHRTARPGGGGAVEPAARPRASPVGDVVPARAHGRPGRGAPEGAPRRRRRRRGDGAARRTARPGGDRGTPSFRSTARAAAVDLRAAA